MEISAFYEAILGPEWDAELLARLKSAFVAAKGAMSEASHVVAGSQEVITYGIALPDGELTATSEPYVGLSIKGPANLVKQLEHVRGVQQFIKAEAASRLGLVQALGR